MDYVISNGLQLTKEKYFNIIEKLKGKYISDLKYIYLNTGEKLKIEYQDMFTLVVKIIL